MSGLWDLPPDGMTGAQIEELSRKYPELVGSELSDSIPYKYFSQNNKQKNIPNTAAYRQVGLAGKPYSPTYLEVYRADPTNKFGGNKVGLDGLEPIPTQLDMDSMARYLIAYREAAKLHPDIMPSITPDHFANIALNEGRSNFGYSSDLYSPTKQNKQAMTVFNSLTKNGFGWDTAGFAAAIAEKNQRAKDLKLPFDAVWNGTGTSRVGRTGEDNANRMAAGSYAAAHPANQPLTDFIKYTLDPGETLNDQSNKYWDAVKQQQKAQDNAPFLDKAQHIGHQLIGLIPDPKLYQEPDISPRRVTPVQQNIEQWQQNQLKQSNTVPLPDGYRLGGRVRMI